MRAWQTDGNGIDNLRQSTLPDPTPGPGEALVRVEAVSLNWRDLRIVSGQYGGQQKPGLIPLSDMCGEVVALGEGTTGLAIGDRVINLALKRWPAGRLRPDWTRTFLGCGDMDGVLCELVSYPAESLVASPKRLSSSESSTLPIAGLTAWAALVTHGGLKAGETVLVQGTGGVSVFAAQLAKALGAQVILTTSSEEKADWAKSTLGVDHTLDYRDVDWPKQVMTLTGKRGIDLVVEVAGGDSLGNALACCGYSARVMVIGVLDGFTSTLDTMQFIRKQIRVQGVFMESAQTLAEFVRAMEALEIGPIVDSVLPFEDAPDAYRRLASGAHRGKVVISLVGG